MNFSFRRAKELPNARLVLDLCRELGGTMGVSSGQLSHFDDVPSNWRCPCCTRTKRGIARLNVRGELYCPIHKHHDHVVDDLGILIQFGALSLQEDYAKELPQAFDVNIATCERFVALYICGDCNRAEKEAKGAVPDVPSYFTFAPFEISQFIGVYPNAGHGIVEETVHRAYAEALPQVNVLRARARDMASRLPGQLRAAYLATPRFTMPE